MENCNDFLEWLGPDISASVLTYLTDPADLVRMSTISLSWRHFIIENGFCKKLCIQMFPELLRVTRVNEVSNTTEAVRVGSSNSVGWHALEKDHKVYGHLARTLMSSIVENCIDTAICASSTDNDPYESIENTLDPREHVFGRPSYWSSVGEKNPEVPETLTYKLKSQLCIVSKISIRPFKATFQHGHPIYSSSTVRFRMGCPKSPFDVKSISEIVAGQRYDDFFWMYISPAFPMLQENNLQTFTLPKPVICIGGIVQIELLGRIQTQELDGLYYICVCHVDVIGRPLSPVFDIEILHPSKGNCVLKYYTNADECNSPKNASE